MCIVIIAVAFVFNDQEFMGALLVGYAGPAGSLYDSSHVFFWRGGGYYKRAFLVAAEALKPPAGNGLA